MLCPLTDNGPVEHEYQDFRKLCKIAQSEHGCDCLAGLHVRARSNVPLESLPDKITIKDSDKDFSKKSTTEPDLPESINDYPGSNRLRSIPAEVYAEIHLSELKPYWTNKVPQTKEYAVCVNCLQLKRINASGCCGRCYNKSHLKTGPELIKKLNELYLTSKPDSAEEAEKLFQKQQQKNDAAKSSVTDKYMKSFPGDNQHGPLMHQRFLIRRQGDSNFKDGCIECFISDTGRLCVSVNSGFEILVVSEIYNNIGVPNERSERI